MRRVGKAKQSIVCISTYEGRKERDGWGGGMGNEEWKRDTCWVGK